MFFALTICVLRDLQKGRVSVLHPNEGVCFDRLVWPSNLLGHVFLGNDSCTEDVQDSVTLVCPLSTPSLLTLKLSLSSAGISIP